MDTSTKAIDADDYVAIAKGVYDSLVPELDSRVKSLQDGFEKDLVVRVLHQIEKAHGQQVKELFDRVQTLEKLLDTSRVVEKSIIYGATGRPEKIIETRG